MIDARCATGARELDHMGRNMIIIPKGTAGVACKAKARGCDVIVYWVPHPSTQKKHPVSASAEGCFAPTKDEDGLGVSHFSDCKFAHEFRKRPTTGS